jgi:hypothetical protein
MLPRINGGVRGGTGGPWILVWVLYLYIDDGVAQLVNDTYTWDDTLFPNKQMQKDRGSEIMNF